MTRLSKKKQPVSVDGLWVWGYVSSDNKFICPVVINNAQFPVGLPVYTQEISVLRKVEGERAISQKIPLPAGQTVHHYQLGDELSPEIFVKAGLHMFRQAMTALAMQKIAGVAEGEFAASMLFIDSPLLKIDDEVLMEMFRADKLRLLSCVEEWDMDEIVEWTPD
jgi:hypothetical protein